MTRDSYVELGLVALFGLLAVAEVFLPANGESAERSSDQRLLANFGLTAIALVAGSAIPIAKLTSAVASDHFRIGLAHIAHVPWTAILIAVIGLESFLAYWVHRLMHVTPLLWRVHRVHHADDAVDVSTSLRNHPLELLFTIPPSALVILAVGAPASVVLAAQTFFMAATICQHADLRVAPWVDRALSMVIITPALHKIHHARDRDLHDSNFSDSLIWWDQLFGTLRRSDLPVEFGLEGQVSRPDHLFDQICSPLFAN